MSVRVTKEANGRLIQSGGDESHLHNAGNSIAIPAYKNTIAYTECWGNPWYFVLLEISAGSTDFLYILVLYLHIPSLHQPLHKYFWLLANLLGTFR